MEPQREVERGAEESILPMPGASGAIAAAAEGQEALPQDLPPAHPSSSPAAALAKDVDADALAVRLDAHSRALRQDLLDYFLQLKDSQLEQRRAAVERQRAEDAAVLEVRQRELEQLQQQLEGQRQRTKRLTAILERAVYRMHKRSRLRKSFQLLARAWRAWRDHTRRMRRIEANYKAAARHYDAGKLGGVFKAWRGWSHTAYRERLKAEHDASIQAARQETWQQANATNLELSQRLEELEGELAAERAAKAKLEDETKSAFMRGVCALNIEAMALMKNGVPPGGVNPFADAAIQLPGGAQGQQLSPAAVEQPGPTAAAALQAEQWLIRSAITQQQAAAPAVPSSTPLWYPPSTLPPGGNSAQPQQRDCSLPPPSPHAGAGAATVQPKPATQVPEAIVKVAPTQRVELVRTRFEGPLAARSPAKLTRPAASVASNLPTNVPEHIAAALSRPQTAWAEGAAGGPRAPKAPADPRRVATRAGAGGGKQASGLSQRSLAAKKGGGPLVVRGPLPAAAGAAQSQQHTQRGVAVQRRNTEAARGQ